MASNPPFFLKVCRSPSIAARLAEGIDSSEIFGFFLGGKGSSVGSDLMFGSTLTIGSNLIPGSDLTAAMLQQNSEGMDGAAFDQISQREGGTVD